MEMVYSNKFAVCVIVDGKVMRELPDGSTGLPFGTEYTLRLFNKHDRKAVAKVSIDTENISKGGFIIYPHEHIDIERRADRDVALKFVELNSDEALLNGKPASNRNRDMGIVEIAFHLEKEKSAAPSIQHINHYPYYPYYPYVTYSANTDFGGMRHSGAGSNDGLFKSTACPVDYHPGGVEISCSASSSQSNTLGFDSHDDFALHREGVPICSKAGCTVDGKATGIKYETERFEIETTNTILKIFLQGFQPTNNRAIG